MRDVTHDNFGLLIAYLVPGATVLLGLSQLSPALRNWFAAAAPDAPTIGGFLYLTVASLAAGMVVSAIRWTVVDTVHAWTGLRLPQLDFSRLGPNVEAYRLLIEIHYQHYQFYSNQFCATAIAFIWYRMGLGIQAPWGWFDAAVVVLQAILWATSRDTIWKYQTRCQQLLQPFSSNGESASR